MGRPGAGAPPAAALIAAAGSGERLGAAGPKALVELAGRPMLEWSLAAFERAAPVAATIVAAPPADLERFATAVESFEGVEVIAGGATRSESVAAGLERVEAEIVAVHDAARPLVTTELISDLIELLAARTDAAGVIAAAPMTDTVKRVSGTTVDRTENRSGLWAAQTPQVFHAGALREAIGADARRLAQATDDAWLVEQAGGKVLIHEASANNLKVTTPCDVRIAELLLSERG